MASWDDLYGLIQKYLRDNTSKEGVVKLLTKKQIGDHPSIGSRVTNPLNRPDLSLKELSREHQYYIFKQHEKDVLDSIIKTLKYVDEQGIQLGKEQLKNLEYNLGVVKLLRKDNLKSEGVLRKDYKLKPSEAFQAGKNIAMKKDRDGGGIMASANNLQDSIKEIMKLADEMKPENIAKKEAVEKAARDKMFKRKWHGRAYEGRSDQYRGLSYQLAKLHEAGIIKLDPKIYDALKEGKYHWAGSEMFAPDPPRIWRYHFGDEIFDKLDDVIEKDIYNQTDTLRGPEAMANWMKKEGIKPIKKKGPKDALDYMDETELIAHAEDAQNSIDIFKSDDNFYSNLDMSDADKAQNRMNAIVQNAEDKKKFLDALKRNYPKSKYKDKPTTTADAEATYKVISEGDEGFKEISEKLGITARPGDNLELESNVVQGPWKGSTKPVKETVSETIDISTMNNDDLNKLVDEIHMNEGKMAEVDSTGGTKMGYQEFKKLEKRNEAIKKALADAQKVYEDLGEATGDFGYDYATWLQKFGKKSSKTTAPGTYTITDHIEYIKTLEPVEAMKEANKMLQGTGKYKGISKADQNKIMEDTNDWINQRDPSDRWDYKNNRPYRDDPNFDPDDPDFDPDDGLYAKGGRVGFESGGWGKGGSNIIDEDWDEGYDDMEGILRLLNQDQTAPQTFAQLDTQGLLDLINQKHGAGSLMRGSDAPQPDKSQEIELRELFNKWNSMYNG